MRRIPALALALALTGAAAEAEAKTRVDLWYGLTGFLGEQVQKVCTNFNASQQDYDLVCTSQGNYEQALQNAIAAYRSNKQPAILQAFEIGTATMMMSGAVLPAHQLMAEQGYKVDWADYVEPIKNYYADSKGNLWSFPFNSSTFVLYLNQTMLEKAGVKDIPGTWEAVEAALRKVKAAGMACAHAYQINPSDQWEAFHMAHGLALASNKNGYEGLDTKLLFDKTLFRRHVETYKRWLDEGLATYYRRQSGVSANDAFARGDCATYAGSIASFGGTARQMPKDQKWTVAFLPIYEGHSRHNTAVGGASLWTFKGFDPAVYKGVAAFYDWLTKPEQQKAWADATGYIPTTRSGYQHMIDTGSYAGPNAPKKVAMESLLLPVQSDLTRGIRLGNHPQLREIVRDELEKIFAGQVSVDEGLASAVRRGNEVLARFEAVYEGKTLP